MHPSIQKLQQAIAPVRQQIIDHRVFENIGSLSDLSVFMNHHIYAVWDFMSLLKTLQINLTCTSVPWFPVGSGDTRYLINEIVTGEESDVDSKGIRMSHYELYLQAMQQAGIDTAVFLEFIDALRASGDVSAALVAAKAPLAAQEFVEHTFSVIGSGKPHVQAAVFTFGREDLIPNMFLAMVNELNDKFPGQVAEFKYYLDRHIEVDGGHHSHLALEMTASLCGDDAVKWQEAEDATLVALQKRLTLWDGVYRDLAAHAEAVTV
jgi:pyrroloquinoline quinone (PQQ) biosynthesis protein C